MLSVCLHHSRSAEYFLENATQFVVRDGKVRFATPVLVRDISASATAARPFSRPLAVPGVPATAAVSAASAASAAGARAGTDATAGAGDDDLGLAGVSLGDSSDDDVHPSSPYYVSPSEAASATATATGAASAPSTTAAATATAAASPARSERSRVAGSPLFSSGLEYASPGDISAADSRTLARVLSQSRSPAYLSSHCP